jgi:HTH-type transcriptional regulator/antitoxin MqsA
MKKKCPICARAELVRNTCDISYTHKGETTVILNVTGDFCPACGEFICDLEKSTRISALMLEFNKQVNRVDKITADFGSTP